MFLARIERLAAENKPAHGNTVSAKDATKERPGLNLLFDSWCSQMLFQQEPPSYPAGVSNGHGAPLVTGMRLNTLLGAIKSIGLSSASPWNVSFTQPPIDASQLKGIQVYISLTRYKTPAFAYTSDELAAIMDWVNSGGNVLLMTNHGGFPNNPLDNWTSNDAALAALFGVTLEDYSIQDFTNSSADRSILLQVQKTIPYLAAEAPKVMAHDSCLIVPPPTNFVSVIEFPSDWTAYDPNTNPSPPYPPPPYPYFSMWVPSAEPGVGSLLVIGNSGWVAAYGSQKPACGLVSSANNLRFALNCIGYLGGLTQQPRPGQCPTSRNPAPAVDRAE